MTQPRQLVLLCDGTNNNLSGRHSDTHVVLLAELLRLYPDRHRLIYYDPGVGNPGQLPGTTFADKLRRVRDRIDGLAFGRGLFDNIAEGYRFLMAHWRPGDQIFVFGFSRGAFTARSIAGLVNAFGIIDSHQDTLVSSLVATYFSRPSPQRKAITEQAARLFGQGDGGTAWPEVHFVGVWDTVASVGLPPFGLKITAKPDLAGKHFRHVRHAMALDEQRAQFLPRAYEQDNGGYTLADGSQGDVKQCWFRGSHCDVGGGNHYPYSELSRAPFAWLVTEALACGLKLPAGPHPALSSEADVLAIMPRLDPDPPTREEARINSETCATPLWALTGLKVRDTVHALVDGVAGGPAVAMATHPSVSQWSHAFPQRTAWLRRGSAGAWLGLAALLLLLAVLFVMMGWQLLAPPDELPLADRLAWALQANLQFQAWQWSLPAPGLGISWDEMARSFAHPVRALLLDLLFIAAYVVLLSPWVCRAFARHAGLIHVGDKSPVWLNRAGWALPLAVAADLLEDVLTAATLWTAASPAGWAGVLLPLLRLLMALASASKWVGLLGAAALILSSFVKHHRPPAAPAQAIR